MRIETGGVVMGGSSLGYRTGKWRDARPVINQELCVECGICFDVCPDSSVEIHDRTYRINTVYCKGCGICAFECPKQAITMITEEK